MQISERVRQLKPSATLTINTLAQELKAGGRDIISLSVGEPDFKTPQHIREAAIKSIEKGYVHYTAVPGLSDLRKAAAGYFNTKYSAGASQENIIVSNGGKHALFNLFMCALNPGDEVLVPAPYWVSYPSMLELAGAVPVIVPAPAAKNFKVTPEDLDRFVTPKTRMCIMNSPSNPTGAVYSAAEVEALANWAISRNIVVVSDEIYDQLIYLDTPYSSFCGWWKKHPENFVVANGVSKSFAMTGWRVGYLLAHPDLVKACNKFQGQSTSNVCTVSQYAAIEALAHPGSEMEMMLEAFKRRRDLVCEMVASWDKAHLSRPDGAFYAFVDMHELYGERFSDSTGLCKYLLEEAGVALVPGEAFGDDACVRLSYATDEATLKIALERVGAAINKK